MITQTQINRKEITEKTIYDSSLDDFLKDQLIDGINNALEGCNGLTTDEKIQKNSENNFQMSLLLSQLFIKIMERKPEANSWKDVVVRCKNQVVFVLISVFILLGFRPELSNFFSAIFQR